MKKQKPKSKKICRKKRQNELETDKEWKQINKLAAQFKEDQFKLVLRRCYQNVQKYGPEAILKAINDDWTAMVAAAHKGTTAETDFVNNYGDKEVLSKNHTTHPHEETAKRNALFLIESSESLNDYDSDTLMEMKRAYGRGNFDDVADLAYIHDRNRRSRLFERRVDDNTTSQNIYNNESPWHRFAELLEEVVEEDQQKESPLKCCVEAVRHLSRDLTYDNRMLAKESIRKAIKYLEE